MPVRSRTPYNSTPVEPITSPRMLRGWWIPDATFAALRVAIALLVIWHGAQELFGFALPPGQRWSGPPVPFTAAWGAAVLQLAVGLLLCVGLLTRSASLTLTVLLAYDVAATLMRSGWLSPGGEVSLVTCVVLLTFAFVGPGLFSFDAVIAARRNRTSGMSVTMSPWIKRQYRRRELTR